MELPPEIFKAYDIRGIVGRTLTPLIVEVIGRALGSLAREKGRDTIVIGRDGRLSGPALAAALSEGIRKAGVDVIDIGMVATPMTYFAAYELGTACSVMVTGSHNPPDYNGLKMVIDGTTLSGDDIQALRTRIMRDAFTGGEGTIRTHDIAPAYFERITSGRSGSPSIAGTASPARSRLPCTARWDARSTSSTATSTAISPTTIPILRSRRICATSSSALRAATSTSASPSMATATASASSRRAGTSSSRTASSCSSRRTC
jgi:hypothetical protein